MAVDFKLCTQQNLPERKGIPTPIQMQAALILSVRVPFKISSVRKKGAWVGKSLYSAMIPPVGSSHRTRVHLEHIQGKEEGGTGSTGQLPMHVLCTTGLLLERDRAEACPVGEVFLGLTSWVLLGQLCGSCPDNSKALSRLSVTNCPSLTSYGSPMPGKQCFQTPPRPASSEMHAYPKGVLVLGCEATQGVPSTSLSPKTSQECVPFPPGSFFKWLCLLSDCGSDLSRTLHCTD